MLANLTMPYLALLWAAMALVGYLLGCMNGALVISRFFYHDDVRKHGSGNAGLTNFYRTYGTRYALGVIAVDLLKAAAACALGGWLLGSPVGEYFMGFFCMLGHMFPVMYHFKGGKGILCSGMTLIMIDWRVALAGWGFFLLMWLTTKYVSLGSICAAISFPIMTAVLFRGYVYFPAIMGFSTATAVLILWAHRGNIVRLLQGTERKVTLGKKKTEGEEKKP